MTDNAKGATPAEIAWQHMDCVRQFLEDTVQTNSKDRDDWAEDVEIAISMLARPDLATPAAAAEPEPRKFGALPPPGLAWMIGKTAAEIEAATQAQPATHAEVLTDEQILSIAAGPWWSEDGVDPVPFARAVIRAAIATQAAQQPKDAGDALPGPGSTSLRSSDPYRDLRGSE